MKKNYYSPSVAGKICSVQNPEVYFRLIQNTLAKSLMKPVSLKILVQRSVIHYRLTNIQSGLNHEYLDQPNNISHDLSNSSQVKK